MHITTKANPVKVNLIIPKPTLPKSILPSQTGQSESCQSYPAKSAKAINYAKTNPAVYHVPRLQRSEPEFVSEIDCFEERVLFIYRLAMIGDNGDPQQSLHGVGPIKS